MSCVPGVVTARSKYLVSTGWVQVRGTGCEVCTSFHLEKLRLILVAELEPKPSAPDLLFSGHSTMMPGLISVLNSWLRYSVIMALLFYSFQDPTMLQQILGNGEENLRRPLSLWSREHNEREADMNQSPQRVTLQTTTDIY